MNTYTCRYFKDVLDVVFTLCVGLLCCLHLDFSFKTGSHVPPTYLLCSQRLQLATDSNQFQWVLTHLWWIADVLQLARTANQIGAIFDHSTCKYGSNCLTVLHCICRWYRNKTFSSSIITNNCQLACKVEFSSILQTSRRSMPGIIWQKMFTYAVTMSQAMPRCVAADFRFVNDRCHHR